MILSIQSNSANNGIYNTGNIYGVEGVTDTYNMSLANLEYEIKELTKVVGTLRAQLLLHNIIPGKL